MLGTHSGFKWCLVCLCLGQKELNPSWNLKRRTKAINKICFLIFGKWVCTYRLDLGLHFFVSSAGCLRAWCLITHLGSKEHQQPCGALVPTQFLIRIVSPWVQLDTSLAEFPLEKINFMAHLCWVVIQTILSEFNVRAWERAILRGEQWDSASHFGESCDDLLTPWQRCKLSLWVGYEWHSFAHSWNQVAMERLFLTEVTLC